MVRTISTSRAGCAAWVTGNSGILTSIFCTRARKALEQAADSVLKSTASMESLMAGNVDQIGPSLLGGSVVGAVELVVDLEVVDLI
jgi:hypothetical protein